MKKCPKCGKTYDDSWGVCLVCSEKLEQFQSDKELNSDCDKKEMNLNIDKNKIKREIDSLKLYLKIYILSLVGMFISILFSLSPITYD